MAGQSWVVCVFTLLRVRPVFGQVQGREALWSGDLGGDVDQVPAQGGAAGLGQVRRGETTRHNGTWSARH